MTAADLPPARQLWIETEGVELAEGDSVEDLKRYLLRNPGMSFVAVAGERLVGAVLAGYDGRRGLLYHLAVARDQRGAGIGRALVERLLAALKNAGAVRMLILVARDNPAGEKFWSKQGWEALTFAEPMGLDL
jgi:ribosomal protein S18 acetylase RimI-like enzyme